MKQLRLPRVLGIAAAVLVPPLAIAQSLMSFSPNTTLTAEALNSNFNTLETRIQALENRLNSESLSKDRIYESVVTLLLEADAQESTIGPDAAPATCEDANDILLNCSCSAGTSAESAAGGSSLAVQIRRVHSRLEHSDEEPRSSCICGGVNTAVSGETDRYLAAKATCLRVE